MKKSLAALARISHQPTVEVRDRPAMTSLRLLAVLNVLFKTDNGIWRRVHMVPFDVTIPEPERDRGLPEKLQTELPGVLNWALAGCLEWQKRGLDPPPEVKTATENYRQEMDSLGVFITECCELNRHARVASSRLYSAYKTWAESAGERAVSQRMLGSLLKERGLESRRSGSSGGYEWYGISLKNVQLVQ